MSGAGKPDRSSAERASLRSLPAVDKLAAEAFHDDGSPAPTRAEAISAARAVLAQRRAELRAGARDDPDLGSRLRTRLRPSFRRVLNGTGVLIHTNLGRSPLPAAAIDAVEQAATGYANLEIDLASGKRGSRDLHLAEMLSELTGAQDALVVNNGAGAALLAIAALGSKQGIAVSRGQLVEIGGGFRVPDVLAQAGVPLIEVGTTNRTRISDYEHAISSQGAAAILRVHQSNFRMSGFVEDVAIEPLCALPVPVIEDIGSGVLIEDPSLIIEEPPVRRSIAAGAAIVSFSGDKLLGGPQAGILVGAAKAITACRRHPLARALRIGRLPLAALAATLALYRDPQRALREVPVLAMLTIPPETLHARAEALAAASGGEIVQATARVGGGALPLLELQGPAVALGGHLADASLLAVALRTGDPPLIPRIADSRVLIDPRTLAEEEIPSAITVIEAALAVARVRG